MRYDVIIIGGGDGDATLGLKILEAGKSCALLCEGRISEDKTREAFRSAGGVLLMGDRVREVKWESDTKVEALFTDNLGDTPLQAGCFVLCSGRFFTRGLKSDMERSMSLSSDATWNSSRTGANGAWMIFSQPSLSRVSA